MHYNSNLDWTCAVIHNENWVALIKHIHTDASEMLLAAVEALLADNGFSVNSSLSEDAVTSATLFRSWGNANSIMFESVATEIVCELEAIFTKYSSTLRLKVQREKM